jgi:biotin transport system substrate-specific component
MLLSQSLDYTSKKEIASSAIQVVGASLFLALFSQIEIHLYFTPVPLTGQTFAVMMIGALLGSKKALATVLLYLTEGCLGLPFFAGGSCGFLKLIGPTGGYLWGFIVQAYLVGLCFEKMKTPTFMKSASALFGICLLQLSFGVLWLAHLVGFTAAISLGFLPFVLGESFKCLCVASIMGRKSSKQ